MEGVMLEQTEGGLHWLGKGLSWPWSSSTLYKNANRLCGDCFGMESYDGATQGLHCGCGVYIHEELDLTGTFLADGVVLVDVEEREKWDKGIEANPAKPKHRYLVF